MKCKILLLGCFSGAWEWMSWTTAWDRPGDDTACQVEYEPVVSSYCKEEKPRGVQSWETQCWWDCCSNTVSYFKPPRLKRNLRTCKESPKWLGTLRMMFEKQVMELGLFNLMKRQPRDNLIATEAEGTLKKTTEANSSQYWPSTKQEATATSNGLGGYTGHQKKYLQGGVVPYTKSW